MSDKTSYFERNKKNKLNREKEYYKNNEKRLEKQARNK